MKTTFRGKLVAERQDFYTLFVFQNLDEPDNSLMRYVTTTKPPNWNGSDPEVGDVGFVECEYVNAGDEYYHRNTGNKDTYNYTLCYFLNFVKEKEKIENKSYKF